MAFGRFGSEFLISSLTGLDQQDLALAAAANGTFGAVFEHEIVVGGGTIDVSHSQLFNADGSQIGAILRVPGAFAGTAIDPDIAALSDGRFVTLQNNIQSTQQPIFESLINADGTLASSGVGVGFSTQTFAGNPSLATRSDGLILSVHQTRDVNATNSNIFATLFNANGAQIGQLSDVTPADRTDQHNPDVAALEDGRFITVYQSDTGLKARFMTVTLGQTFPLDAAGAEISIASDANTDFRPAVTQIDGGGFMVAYYAPNNTVNGRIYNANGVLQGATFVIANTSADGGIIGDRDIAITTLTNGDVVVAWTGTQGTAGLQSPETATSGTYVDFKVFNPAVFPGQPGFFVTQASGDPRLDGATTVFAGNQFDPALTALADGRFVLGFTDQSGGSQSGGDDASGLALRGQIFDLRTAGVTVTGTAGNDHYIGSDFNDVLDGLGGVDTADFSDKTLAVVVTLNGAIAVNVTVGGVVEDSLKNIENLIGGTSVDSLTGDGLANVLKGGAGEDVLNGLGGVDTADFSDKTLAVVATLNGAVAANVTVGGVIEDSVRNIENLIGGTAADTLTGDGLANVLNGGGGNDTLNGGGDALSDTLVGGLGNDTYIFNSTNDNIVELVGEGTADRATASVSFVLAAGDNIEFLETTNAAGLGAINLSGNEIAQTITGNDGANILNGGTDALADTLIGLGGNDTYIINSATDNITEFVGGGTADRAKASVSFVLTAGDNIEVLETTNAAGVGLINLTGNEFVQTITGNAGANILNGGIDDVSDTLFGGLGNDTYIINTSNDLITEFVAGGTADVVQASISFTLANDDYIETMLTTDAALTTAINLTGNALRQVITGNAGVNILNGGVDVVPDTLVGGLGNDTYIINTSSDLITEFVAGGAADVVQASVSFTLANDDYIDIMQTTDAALLTAINLTGNSVSQSLIGNAGANILNGMFGNDILTGGLGADTFLFNTALGAANRDVITDFNVAADTIQLENTGIFTALGAALGVLDVNLFKNLTTGGAVDATDRILYNDTTGAIFYDADGTGATAAIQFATLTGSPTVTNADFFVV